MTYRELNAFLPYHGDEYDGRVVAPAMRQRVPNPVVHFQTSPG